MSTVFWMVGIVIAVFVAWYVLKVVVGAVTPPENSGRLILKKLTRECGVDVSRIPDSAWNELIQHHLDVAKAMARANILPEHSDWRENFIKGLEGEAVVVAQIIGGESGLLTQGRTRQTLVKYGVLKT
jgi:hypothetical protein